MNELELLKMRQMQQENEWSPKGVENYDEILKSIKRDKPQRRNYADELKMGLIPALTTVIGGLAGGNQGAATGANAGLTGYKHLLDSEEKQVEEDRKERELASKTLTTMGLMGIKKTDLEFGQNLQKAKLEAEQEYKNALIEYYRDRDQAKLENSLALLDNKFAGMKELQDMKADLMLKLQELKNQGALAATKERGKNAVTRAATVKAEKPPTEGELKNANYASIMELAEQDIEKTIPLFATRDLKSVLQSFAGDVPLVGNLVKPGWKQQYDSGAWRWADAALRIETGAAATEGEIRNKILQYIPQPGDTPETIALKKQARAEYKVRLRNIAGKAFDRAIVGIPPKKDDPTVGPNGMIMRYAREFNITYPEAKKRMEEQARKVRAK